MNTTATDESRLIRKAQAGDAQAFGELVTAYQRFVYNLALRSMGDPQEAQDATQECFLRVWRALPQFRGECRFSTWLYRVAVNVCFNHRPRILRDLAAISVDASIESGQDFPVDEDNPSWAVESSEQRAFLHQAVERLPGQYRLLISLRYIQELSYEEIAEVLSMPLGTVKTGLHRAKNLLKTELLERLETRAENQKEVAEWVRCTTAG